MACSSRNNRIQKRKAFRKKLHILRALTNSKSVETSSIIMDAFLYISALKLKLEAIKRENMNLINHTHELPLLEVKVDYMENNRYQLRVLTNTKGRNDLVHILQAFEEIGINVIQAKVSCNNHFFMEATVEVNNNNHAVDNVDDYHQAEDPSALTELVLRAIERSGFC